MEDKRKGGDDHLRWILVIFWHAFHRGKFPVVPLNGHFDCGGYAKATVKREWRVETSLPLINFGFFLEEMLRKLPNLGFNVGFVGVVVGGGGQG